MDLLTVRLHETGHPLGQEQEGESWMPATRSAGTRRFPSTGADLLDVAVLDRVFVSKRESLASRC
jgi:hypothetical protein